MRRILSFTASTALFAGLATAESFSGTVVDVSCAKKDLATHSRQCALGCAKSGFGLVTADGKFHKFNEAGNAKTLDALKASSRNADLKATVNGKLSGETLEVESISLQ